MTLITDSITYNVRERGRKHRGVDRNFDTAALAKMINGPSVQERVRHGDMLGYLGHWPRLVFGMTVQEGGIDPTTGKAVALPVAIRTTELHADADGTITHRAEFLDTEAGKIAEGMYSSKAGGFSSAIEPVRGTNPCVPRDFHGFDFVYEPNYTTNRGHRVVLDGVEHEIPMLAMLDSALAMADMGTDHLAAMFDSLHAQHLQALESLERTAQENEELLDLVARLSGKDRKQVLDSIGAPHVRPELVLPANIADWTQFRDAPLTALSELPRERPQETADTRFAQQRYGVSI